MATPKFNTADGQTIARELLIAYINTADSRESPGWSPIGSRVEDSSAEYDWGEESSQDILGTTRTTMKKPVITQAFDPLPLDAGDKASVYIWGLAVYLQDAQALANQDMLIVHFYTTESGSVVGSFAERYESCAIRVTSLGGEGGGNLGMPTEVTYGGTRTLGTASKDGGAVTFTPAA